MSLTNPENDAPRNVRERLLKFGGKTPFGKPVWRVTLAQNNVVKRGGVFCELPGGEQSIFAYGPDGKVHENPVLPTSSKFGMCVEMPKYPCEDGWILERWMAAEVWGSRDWWESQKAKDGFTPLLGPYPSEGDYWLIAGPRDELWDLTDIENAISMYEHTQRNKPRDLEAHLQQQMRDEESLRIARRVKLEETLEKIRKSELLPVLKGTSLSAQAFRNELNRLIGDRSHFGAL